MIVPVQADGYEQDILVSLYVTFEQLLQYGGYA